MIKGDQCVCVCIGLSYPSVAPWCGISNNYLLVYREGNFTLCHETGTKILELKNPFKYKTMTEIVPN